MSNNLPDIIKQHKKKWPRIILVVVCTIIINSSSAQLQDSVTSLDTVAKQKNFEPSSIESKQFVQTRSTDQLEVEKLRKDDAFWYVNTAPVREEAKPPSESFTNKLATQKWFRNLMWVLIISGFIAVLIWFLVSSNVKLFRKKPAAVSKPENNIVAENIFAINYGEEIHKAINTADYRLAIRLMYLQLLKDLSQKQIIHYKQERTNNDYLMQLYNTQYYKTFFQLTRNYEYTWYGRFQIKPEAFKTIQSEFTKFNQGLL